jgi:hypothetical protein
LDGYHAVIVKDHWRIQSDELTPEGDTYDALAAVDEMQPYLAQLIEKGNVSDHTTRDALFPPRRSVDAIVSQDRGEKTIHHLVHYRMVFKTVGFPLGACQSPKRIGQVLIGILKGMSLILIAS